MKYLFLCCFVLAMNGGILQAQDDDLLGQLGNEPVQTERITNAFKSPRVINSHSMEMLPKGVLDFRILHRFGRLDGGLYDFFGLDQARMRLSFDYGILPDLSVGVGRSNAKKEVDGYVKYRILCQSKGAKRMPLSLVWISGMTINGLKDATGSPELSTTFERRLGYYHQLIVGRKFSERFTLQLSPLLVHQNLTSDELIDNTYYALELGGRFKITRRIAVVWDYLYAFNRFPNKLEYNPLSLGFDIETGGHVFQLHFTNAAGMNERAFIRDNNANWLKGEISFGFNLSRVFQLN